ncbi:MAG: TonB family protein [Candidatus Obscuribacterales bacterium]|nr:TonB family protein [Candidatus Obscuribacterales bacterium]
MPEKEKKATVRTFQEERQLQLAEDGEQQALEFPNCDPKKAARLSLIPGLGQLYVGDKRRGYLYLAVSATNFLILGWMFFSEPILKAIENVFGSIGLQVHWDSASPLQVHFGSALSFVILGLIISFTLFASRQAYDYAKRLKQGYIVHHRTLMLSETTSGSYLAHFAFIMAFLVLILFFIAPKPPQEQITEIELVPSNPAPKKNPSPAAPKKAPEPPKPVPPKPVPKQVVRPVAPTPIAVVSPKPAPDMVPMPAPQPAPTAPSTSSGGGSSSGGTGSGEGDDGDGAADVDYGSWLTAMQRKIKKSWFPPRGNESNKIVIGFKAHRDGTVTGIKMVTSSGVAVADQAAVEAIKQAQPLPPLPKGAPDMIQVNFKFDYDVFSGTGSFRQF